MRLMELSYRVILYRKDFDCMDIEGLDIVQISRKMTEYVKARFDDFALSESDSLFQENYLLDFDEVKGSIPTQYHKLFGNNDKFNCASGFVDVGTQSHILMLLADESYKKAYLLIMQMTDREDVEEIILIKDFLCS
jgi:hypothetical protein